MCQKALAQIPTPMLAIIRFWGFGSIEMITDNITINIPDHS